MDLRLNQLKCYFIFIDESVTTKYVIFDYKINRNVMGFDFPR